MIWSQIIYFFGGKILSIPHDYEKQRGWKLLCGMLWIHEPKGHDIYSL